VTPPANKARKPRPTRAELKAQRAEVKQMDRLVPGAWAFWLAGWRLLLADRRSFIALAVAIALSAAVFGSGLGGEQLLVGAATKGLAWLIVTIAVLRMPVLGVVPLVTALVTCIAITSLQLLPGRVGIAGALFGAFLGAAPGLLWRGKPIITSLRYSAVLLVRRLAGAVAVCIVLVLAPIAVVALTAWGAGNSGADDLDAAGTLVGTLYAVLLVISLGPMYAAMAQWLSVVEPTRSSLPTNDREAFPPRG